MKLATPLSSGISVDAPKTGGFASPPFGGFALEQSGYYAINSNGCKERAIEDI